MRPAHPRRFPLRLSLAAVLACAAADASATVFTVTTTNDAGTGSLRAAITALNAAGNGNHEIRFAIGSGERVIRPQTALPSLSNPGNVLVDGRSQPGYVDTPLIRIDGGDTPANTSGLRLNGGSVRVRGLMLTRFPADGIAIGGGAGVHVIEGNAIGTSGRLRLGNGGSGIAVFGDGTRVDIGGSSAAARNIVSCNGRSGIDIGSSAGTVNVVNNLVGLTTVGACGNTTSGITVRAGATRIGGGSSTQRNVISGNLGPGVDVTDLARDTRILGNLIGLGADGTLALGNGGGGIRDYGAGTQIGGTGSGDGNTISGNNHQGAMLAGSGTLVYGNRIGTDPSGTLARGNRGYGIRAYGVFLGRIGGVGPGARNLISGNERDGLSIERNSYVAVQGNHIGTDPAGNAAVPNGGGIAVYSDGIVIGGTAAGEGNLVSGNHQGGVVIAANDVRLRGNRIGTNAARTAALPNDGSGVRVYSGTGAQIGDGTAAGRNLVAGNVRAGIEVDHRASNITIAGNHVGTDGSGQAALPNAGGINISGTRVAVDGNVVSGNTHSGIAIGTDAVDVDVRDNLVGLAADGDTVLGNEDYAVRVLAGDHIRIGAPGRGNVLSGNGRGVSIETFGVAVQGNIVGLDAGGTQARGNGGGIDVYGANNLIGGSGAGEGNQIAANGYYGVALFGTAAYANRVEGNTIGTNLAGADGLGNDYAGVTLYAARANTIGGLAPGSGNTIAGNGRFGVYVWFGANNAILGNRILGHERTGIELEPQGPSELDAGDTDHGANEGQNAPELQSASLVAGQLDIAGRLRAAPSTTYRIEWFHSAQCGNGGLGEGETFLGATDATTDASGHATLAAQFALAGTGGVVTATATDPLGNTSEFSACLDIGTPHGGRMGFWGDTLLAYEDFEVLHTAVVRSGGNLGPASVRVVARNGSATQGDDFGLPTPAVLHFADGETIKNVSIPLVLDDRIEGNEAFRLELVDITGAVAGAHADVEVILFDHEGAWPFYGARDAAVREPMQGVVPVDVTLTLSGGDHAVDMEWKTVEGTAFAGEDFIEASGIVRFEPGETEKVVQVLVRADTIGEPEETFYVQVRGNPAGQQVIAGDSEAEVVIRDNPTLFSDGFE